MARAKHTLNECIALRIARSKRDVFLTRDFASLSGEDQIIRALRVLVGKQKLIRLGKGVYAKARLSSLTGMAVLANPEGFLSVAQQALERLQVVWEPSDAQRAFSESRSTQIPANPVLKVKGRFSRKLRYGSNQLVIERGAKPTESGCRAEVGNAIRRRRAELGLTQAFLADLSGLRRHTISDIERGMPGKLSHEAVRRVMIVVGLSPGLPPFKPKHAKRALWMAANSSSVSYRRAITPEVLGHTLSTGDLSAQFIPQVGTFLEEAPVPLLVMAVEEAAAGQRIAPHVVWRNVALLADRLDLVRSGLFRRALLTKSSPR
ncbi:DUF6088 family protein [Stenotrophomonas bentonitica]